jgi:hypothetical protein
MDWVIGGEKGEKGKDYSHVIAMCDIFGEGLRL